MNAADKMALVTHAAKKVGVEIVKPSFNPVGDRPDFLDRPHKVPGLIPAFEPGTATKPSKRVDVTKVKDVAKVIKRGAVV